MHENQSVQVQCRYLISYTSFMNNETGHFSEFNLLLFQYTVNRADYILRKITNFYSLQRPLKMQIRFKFYGAAFK